MASLRALDEDPLTDGRPLLCEPGGEGTMILPIFGNWEQGWPAGLRVVLYILGLGWCFMGVALISDIFMGAIEHITSKKTRKFNTSTGRFYTALVWNPTVANLTLMALGSSAPEIMLNVVETIFSNKMFSGDLGPSTIVGSAAFNLLIIIAVCVVAIPDGQVRKIKELPVYAITAVFSVFAYLWLVIVLMIRSPNVIEMFEGIITFLLFPILVTLAYLADRGYFTKTKKGKSAFRTTIVCADMSKEELAELYINVRREFGSHITDEQVDKIIALRNGEMHSRAHYRVATTRAMTGGKRLKVARGTARPSMSITSSVTDYLGSLRKSTAKVVPVDDELDRACCYLEFHSANYAVIENAGFVRLKVLRRGILEGEAVVRYQTRDGTAKAQCQDVNIIGDYIEAEGSLHFAPGETEKIIEVKILDDNTYEEDEEFYVDLFDPIIVSNDTTAQTSDVQLVDSITGQEVLKATAKVTIIDDDSAGTICWAKETETLQEKTVDTTVFFEVHRKSGSKGKILCKYETENITAMAGTDYERTEGEVELEDGICVAKVPIKILARGRYGTSESFRIVLTDIKGMGAKFDPATDGGEESCILTVFISADTQAMERVDRMMNSLMSKWQKTKISSSSWKDQFIEALYVNGGGGEGDEDEDDDDDEPPSLLDKCMHVLLFPWKIVFAFCPPVDYCGGWLCFMSSLFMIGGVTVIISDMANLFGCVLPFMENEITAITFVALGTSLPDTFASRTAALQDPYADASVGNVTGSNSVNVFLGLGLPWMIASIYWASVGSHEDWSTRYQNDPDLEWLGPAGSRDFAYVVKAGSLGFSVIVFAVCALSCIALLAVRRRIYGGELGGTKVGKWATFAFLVFLWLIYVFLSILKVKGVL